MKNKLNEYLNPLRYLKSRLKNSSSEIANKGVYLYRTLKKNGNKEKVFGIGMPKTGTTTLGAVLDTLGYRHYTYDMDLTVKVRKGDLTSLFRKIRHYDSFEDWPWHLVYKELDKNYPEAKFILTVRKSTNKYVDSLKKHHLRQGVAKPEFDKPYWWDGVFDFQPNEWDYDKAKHEYEKHNEDVMHHFKNREDKLLIICWEDGDEWSKICKFLNEKVPKKIFPHKNKSI